MTVVMLCILMLANLLLFELRGSDNLPGAVDSPGVDNSFVDRESGRKILSYFKLK